MRYELTGGSLPVLTIFLDAGEFVTSEAGGRSWQLGDINSEVVSSGGIGKALGRLFSGESLFLSKYQANGAAQIAFTSSFPGSIVPIQLAAGQSIICQKRSYLASVGDVQMSIFFQKKISSGLFGGEGFIMQKIVGPGTVFLEIDGFATTYELAAGQRLTCDTGVVAYMDETCSMSVETVGGLKNMMFGGEGVFDTVVTGPGKVTVQSMPISKVVALLQPPSSK